MSTRTDDHLPPPASPTATGISAALAAAATVLTGRTAADLLPPATALQGEEALMTLLLGTIAAAGAVLCAYLTVIWGLACLALVSGPATGRSAAAVTALRVLAPRLARRVTLSAALATTAAGLVVGPAAASTLPDHSPAAEQATATASAVLHPTAPAPVQPGDDPAADDGVGQDDEHAPAPPTPPAGDAPAPSQEPSAPEEAPAPEEQSAAEEPELPSLGWGESPSTTTQEGPGTAQGTSPGTPESESAPPPQAEPAPAPPPRSGTTAPQKTGSTPSQEAGDAGADPQDVTPRTITVTAGDTLWSLTDELLGPGPDSVTEISAAWPLLYEANQDVIGPHPDLIEPGQVLIVPAAVTTQEQS